MHSAHTPKALSDRCPSNGSGWGAGHDVPSGAEPSGSSSVYARGIASSSYVYVLDCRDLAMRNLLVSVEGERATVKVADFGLSRFTTEVDQEDEVRE